METLFRNSIKGIIITSLEENLKRNFSCHNITNKQFEKYYEELYDSINDKVIEMIDDLEDVYEIIENKVTKKDIENIKKMYGCCACKHLLLNRLNDFSCGVSGEEFGDTPSIEWADGCGAFKLKTDDLEEYLDCTREEEKLKKENIKNDRKNSN